MNEDLIKLAQQRLDDWGLRSRQWYWIYYICGGLATAFVITVASRPVFLQSLGVEVATLAWLAALFQGLNTFLGAFPKASAYRAAWRMLWLARMDYVASRGGMESEQKLQDTMVKGWTIIDGGYLESRNQDGRAQKSASMQSTP